MVARVGLCIHGRLPSIQVNPGLSRGEVADTGRIEPSNLACYALGQTEPSEGPGSGQLANNTFFNAVTDVETLPRRSSKQHFPAHRQATPTQIHPQNNSLLACDEPANGPPWGYAVANECGREMMNPSNSNVSVIRQDRGEMNQKLLQRQALASLAPVESAGRIVKMSFSSPEGKRLFLRYFDITQLHMHYISKIARLSLPDADIEQVEKQVLELVEEKIDSIDKEMVRVEQELQKNNIDSLATYVIEPLTLEVRMLGKIGRRLLELIGKVDQLMPMLETLAIDELISESQLSIKKNLFKRMVRSVGGIVRTLKIGLQRKSAALANTDKTAAPKKNEPEQRDHPVVSASASDGQAADDVISDSTHSNSMEMMTCELEAAMTPPAGVGAGEPAGASEPIMPTIPEPV